MNYARNISLLALAICLMTFFSGCESSRSKHTKNGKEYGVTQGLFRARWWNYYERGSSFAEGGFWEESARDFKEAIKQRPDDQRRTRTYGMHFINYFPHRELGIVFYETGHIDEAIKELETSLATVDSAKAKFFLNKCRESRIKSTGLDKGPPKIVILDPGSDIICNRFSITVSGEVEDDNFISSISINGSPKFIELTQKKLPFESVIDLSSGTNVVTVVAKDLVGHASSKTIRIKADWNGPQLSVNNWTDGEVANQRDITLNISLFDESGLKEMITDDKRIVFNGEKTGNITYKTRLKKGKNILRLMATDMADNVTEGTLSLTYNSHMGSPHPPSSIIRLASRLDIASDVHLFSLKNGERGDTLSPVIKLRGLSEGLEEGQRVFVDSFFIEGQASDPDGIETLEINGEALMNQPRRTVFFNAIKKLKEGANTFEIVARDTSGNTSAKILKINRSIQKIYQIGSRMSAAVMPFAVKGKLRTPLTDIIYDAFLASLVNQKRFNVVVRGAEFEAVLKELKLSQTSLVDKENAVEVGKLIASEGMFMGSIMETPDSIEIFARLVNTETGNVMAVHDVFDQNKSLSSLKYLLKGLALKFRQSIPLIDGIVLKIKGKQIYLDMGSSKNVIPEMKCIIYKNGEPIIHPLTGKVLGADTETLGSARLFKVFPEFSVANLLPGANKEKIKARDRAITKEVAKVNS